MMNMIDEFLFCCTPDIKLCNRCDKFKSKEEFYTDKRTKDGRYGSCKNCHRKITDHWKKEPKNKDKVINIRRKSSSKPYRRYAYLKRRYGIDKYKMLEMISKQDNRCAICLVVFAKSEGSEVHVDHCHNTGRVREILCRKCNNALGCVNDSINVLSNMIKYLEKHNGKAA